MKKKTQIGLLILVVALFTAVPLILDSEKSYFVYFLFMAFTYIALSQSWNLVAGYTGQISLGLYAFFGLGAYVIAVGWGQEIIGFFDPLGMFFAGLIPAILAVAIGIPLLSKLRGDYFALGTLGLGEILRLIFIQGGALTGGSAGLMLPSSSYTSMLPYYFIALFLAVFATLVTYLMVHSSSGWALKAVRDDETAAAANGVNVLKYKVLAFAVGAFIAGLCGGLQAYYLFHVHPQNFFGLNWTLYPILMCVMGGVGSISGPVIGAIFLTAVFELTKILLPGIHPILSGLLIVLTVIFLPNGIVRLRWFGKFLSRSKTDSPLNLKLFIKKEK